MSSKERERRVFFSEVGEVDYKFINDGGKLSDLIDSLTELHNRYPNALMKIKYDDWSKDLELVFVAEHMESDEGYTARMHNLDSFLKNIEIQEHEQLRRLKEKYDRVDIQ